MKTFVGKGGVTINNRKDILLLLLYSPTLPHHDIPKELNIPIIGRTRLMKMLFLFKEEVFAKFKEDIELSEGRMYEFYPWSYGPFSQEVYEDLEFFSTLEFIQSFPEDSNSTSVEEFEELSKWNAEFLIGEDDPSESINEYQEGGFKLTAKGMAFTEVLYNGLSENQKRILSEFKGKFLKASLFAILQYVYEKYENMVTRSKIKDKFPSASRHSF